MVRGSGTGIAISRPILSLKASPKSVKSDTAVTKAPLPPSLLILLIKQQSLLLASAF